MKEKDMRKIAEKLNRIGKAKVEKDGKGEEYIIFSSGFLPCDEEIHRKTLERDLMYVRELMLFAAHEEEDAYADAPKLRAKWLESIYQTVELEAEWENIIPDRYIVLLLRDHGQGYLYVINFMSAGYEEDEIRKIWIDDSKMDISDFVERLDILGCDPTKDKVKWNFAG